MTMRLKHFLVKLVCFGKNYSAVYVIIIVIDQLIKKQKYFVPFEPRQANLCLRAFRHDKL